MRSTGSGSLSADPKPPFSSTPPALHILGPFSSGSFDSLKRILGTRDVSVDISTGMANGGGCISYFQQDMPALRRSDFADFQEADHAMIGRFLCGLYKNGYHPGSVAILSEDETAFGTEWTSPQAGKPSGGGCDPKKEQPGTYLDCIPEISQVSALNMNAPLCFPHNPRMTQRPQSSASSLRASLKKRTRISRIQLTATRGRSGRFPKRQSYSKL